ncbi:MAG: PrsW family intramembrane metalloprotease [Isosphaeraceae bacterium]
MIAETSVPRPIVQRWRWLAVFLSGLVLWILSVVVTGLTQNPTLIPTVVLLGSFLVPATAVIYYLDHSPSTTVSAQRVFLAFLYGGVLGVLAASVLEAWLLQNGPLVYVGVGLIEEFVKVLALLLVALGIRHFTTRDGIVLGASVGFGFAALESSGYALSALFTPNGLSLTSLVFAEVLRGVLAPLGHGLWTGILGGALFTAASKRGRLAIFSLRFIGLFLLVSLLHALWDSMRGLAIVMTLLVTSSPALNVLMQGGLLPQTTDVVTWIFLAFEFGGMAVVSAIGLLMLRRAWRRARPPIASLTSTTRPSVLDA